MSGRVSIGCLFLLTLATASAAAAEARHPVALQRFASTDVTQYEVDVVSSDGRTVAGIVRPQFEISRLVRWVDGTIETMMTTQDTFAYHPIRALTPDGGTLVGRRSVSGWDHGFVWRDGVTTDLEPPPSVPWVYSSEGWDVSPDGRLVVGWLAGPYAYAPHVPQIWRDAVPELLPLPAEFQTGEARFLSEDGRRIVGVGEGAVGRRLLVWEDGSARAIEDASGQYVRVDPVAMSPDAIHVVGEATSPAPVRAFHWDGERFSDLGNLPGGIASRAMGVSQNAEVIVGNATLGAPLCTGSCPTGQTAFIWTPATGMRPLKEYLQYGCGYDLNGWGVGVAAVSDNGRFLAFPGYDPDGLVGAFVVEIGDFCDPDYAVPENPLAPGDFIATNPAFRSVVRIDRQTREQAIISQAGILGQVRYAAQGPGDELFVLSGYTGIMGVDVHTGAQRRIAEVNSYVTTLAIDRNGQLYATDQITYPYPPVTRLLRIDPATGAKILVAQGPLLDPGSGQLLADRDGTLIYRNAQNTLLRIDPDTGAMSAVAVGDLGNQANLSLTRDGRAVTLDYTGIRIIDLATGARRFVVPDIASVGLPFLIGLSTSIDASDRLLVPNQYLHRLDAAHLDSGALDRIAIYGYMNQPSHAIEWRARCDDGFDNDGDGLFDYPEDPGCRGRDDPDETHIVIGIDIVPGSAQNSLPPVGPIPVAVLGSASFDVRSLDVASVRFGPGGAQPLFHGAGVRLDLNHDGYRDWTLFFRPGEAAILDTATQACLSAEDESGMALYGCDAVTPTPRCELGPALAFALLPLWWRRRR